MAHLSSDIRVDFLRKLCKGDTTAFESLYAAFAPMLYRLVTDNEGLSTYSVPIYRYAEALLFYAEAACRAEGAHRR